jgi:hypothetical protein
LVAHPSRIREIRLALLSIVSAALVGLYCKRGYHGPAESWVRDSAGGVFYEIFWCLAAVLLLPRVRAARISAGVFVVTCCLEFLQLWHPPLLEAMRANFLGRTVLGSFFDWGDFLYYVIGSLAGYIVLRAIGRA